MKIKKCGIYHILCTSNNKGYIGSSLDIYSRWITHKWHLEKNTHANLHLQNAYNKYGISSFKFEILIDKIPIEYLVKIEQWFKDKSVVNSEFNIRKDCQSNFGIKMSDNTKQKIRMKAIGRKPNAKIRKKLSDIKLKRLKDPNEVNKILLNFGPDGASFKGSKNSRSKINEVQALEIINRLNNGEHPNSIKNDYPIGVNAIYAIKAKKTWSHV